MNIHTHSIIYTCMLITRMYVWEKCFHNYINTVICQLYFMNWRKRYESQQCKMSQQDFLAFQTNSQNEYNNGLWLSDWRNKHRKHFYSVNYGNWIKVCFFDGWNRILPQNFAQVYILWNNVSFFTPLFCCLIIDNTFLSYFDWFRLALPLITIYQQLVILAILKSYEMIGNYNFNRRTKGNVTVRRPPWH